MPRVMPPQTNETASPNNSAWSGDGAPSSTIISHPCVNPVVKVLVGSKRQGSHPGTDLSILHTLDNEKWIKLSV